MINEWKYRLLKSAGMLNERRYHDVYIGGRYMDFNSYEDMQEYKERRRNYATARPFDTEQLGTDKEIKKLFDDKFKQEIGNFGVHGVFLKKRVKSKSTAIFQVFLKGAYKGKKWGGYAELTAYRDIEKFGSTAQPFWMDVEFTNVTFDGKPVRQPKYDEKWDWWLGKDKHPKVTAWFEEITND